MVPRGLALGGLVVGLGACVGLPPEPPPESSATDGSAGSSMAGLDSGSSTTLGATSVVSSPTADGSAGPTTSDTLPDPTAGTDTGGTCAPAEAALGQPCTDPSECCSGECYVVGPLGGVCSECSDDVDCADVTGYGCNLGNPLSGMPALCSFTGGFGEGCESNAACQRGLVCTSLIEIPGIVETSTCGECGGDGDCSGAQLCAPNYDLATFGGYYQCVDPGSITDDRGCDLSGSGDAQCSSGQCAPASLMGIPVIGVCSPCNEDLDCPGGGTCQLPELVLGEPMFELIPGECV